MNLTLFFFIVTFLILGSIWLTKRAAEGQKTNDDYFLMGRKLGLFSLLMTLLATQIGGGALIGASEEAFSQGWTVLFYPLGMVIGLLIIGFGYGAKLRRLNLTTIPEIFEKIYKSPRLREVAAMLSIVSLYVILIGQGIAARKFFSSLGLNGHLLYIGFWLLLVCYTTIGGLKAVVSTDIMQTLFILGAFALAIFVSFSSPVNLTETSSFTPLKPATPWITWLLMPLLFMLIEQDVGQRCFAAKKPRTVTSAALIAGVTLFIVSLVPIYFGRKAAYMGLDIPEGSSVLITSISALTNPTISTCVICAILMAVISTADSLLCSISSNISCDFPKISQSITTSKMITLGVGISTLALSFMFDNILTMLMFSYELAISVLFVPVTMAIWTNNPRKQSATVAMIIGISAFILCKMIAPPLPKEFIILFSTFGGFILTEWIVRQSKEIHAQPTHIK